MENRTKLEIGVFVLMALLTSGAYFVGQEDQAYYCETSGLVGICEKLSSGLGTRCYFGDTYKTCSTGWQLIEKEIEPVAPSAVQFEVFANGEVYTCSSAESRITSYTICTSPTNKGAYLGELV